MTSVAQLMREANPVPRPEAALTPDEFDALLVLTEARSGTMDVRQVETPAEQRPKDQRKWLVAAAAFAAAVIIIGGVALLLSWNTREPEPVAPEPASLPGNEFRVVAGLNQNLPQRIVFGEDGAFQVIDNGRTVDSGTYTIKGDQLSFVSVWEAGRAPEGWGIWWTADDDGSGGNSQLKANKCEGVVGDYQLVFEAPATVTLEVVYDECIQRNYVANGLRLELVAGG